MCNPERLFRCWTVGSIKLGTGFEFEPALSRYLIDGAISTPLRDDFLVCFLRN